jgi:hypothetical protein
MDNLGRISGHFDRDRIVGIKANWLRVYGMVSPAPGFTQFPQVLNGASSLIQELFEPEIGDHARGAIGVGALQCSGGDRGGGGAGMIDKWTNSQQAYQSTNSGSQLSRTPITAFKTKTNGAGKLHLPCDLYDRSKS